MKGVLAAFLIACALTSATSAVAQTAPLTFPNPTLAAVRINVTDLERSERFYRETFTLPAAQAYGDHERVLSLPGANATRLTLIHTDDTPENGGLAMIVADMEATMRAATAAGGRVTREPQAMNVGGPARIGFIEDPDGVSIELIQIAAPPAQ